MQIPDPYKWLPDSAHWPAILIFMMLSAGLLVAMRSLDVPLKSKVSPKGIVSFELAKNYKHAKQILDSWNPKSRVYAALSIGLDYLFLIVYALFISISCVRLARFLKSRIILLSKLGLLLGWAQFIAAFLDAIENFALIQLILGSTKETLPVLARWCAVIKFGLVGAGLVYILAGIMLIIVMKSLNVINRNS